MYLRERGLEPGPDGWPPSLRYHLALRHGYTGLLLPALVAAITIWPGRNVVGVHRTFLRADGKGKAPVTKAKMMIGRCGGGAVRLAPASAKMIVAEGIESALSVLEATGVPTWAALSTSGMEGLVLPGLPLGAEVIIAADHDSAGLHAAHLAAERWFRQGRKVRIAKPPVEGADFNDLAMQQEVTNG